MMAYLIFKIAASALISPSFSLFLSPPVLMKKGLGFYPALAISIAVMLLLYFVMIHVLKRFGIQL